MKVKAAVTVEHGKPFEIEEIDLDGPREHEVLVRFRYAGMCHSDLHAQTGDLPGRLPMVAGHEGAGVVEEVGPGVTRVKPGDHVVCSFIPSCGTCRWCSTGQQAICDLGATLMEGSLPGHRPFPRTGLRGDYGGMCMLGTWADHGTLHEGSIVKIDKDLPLDRAALVGCGVTTGWGSSVYAADVRPGETVLIYGVGGVGSNAVQGARHAGASAIIAVDPVAFKRENAELFGATHSVADNDAAFALAQELTRGVGADKAIVTVGVVKEPEVTAAFNSVRKGGTVVITGLGALMENTIQLPSAVMALFKKTVKGSLFGDANPTHDIPWMLELYRRGDLKIDELITRRYSLEDVNLAYEDLEAGRNIRGLIDLNL